MNDYYADIEFKEVDRKKKVRKKKHYLLRFLIFLVICMGVFLFLSSDFFQLKKISVEGQKFYSEEQVINLSEVKMKQNILWGKSIRGIPEKLMKDPYFEEVKVKRVFPSGIVIRVKERRQIAAAVYGEEYVVIDEEGTVLRKSSVDPKLTVLYGLTISKLEIGEKLEAEEKSTLNLTLKMLTAMRKGDIFFKKIDMSKVVIKAYIYDYFLVKGTPKQIIASLEKGELQKVVNNLLRQDTTRGTINMGDHNYMSFSPNF